MAGNIAQKTLVRTLPPDDTKPFSSRTLATTGKFPRRRADVDAVRIPWKHAEAFLDTFQNAVREYTAEHPNELATMVAQVKELEERFDRRLLDTLQYKRST